MDRRSAKTLRSLKQRDSDSDNSSFRLTRLRLRPTSGRLRKKRARQAPPRRRCTPITAQGSALGIGGPTTRQPEGLHETEFSFETHSRPVSSDPGNAEKSVEVVPQKKVAENYREAFQASSYLHRFTQGVALGCYLFALSGRLTKLDSIVKINDGQT